MRSSARQLLGLPALTESGIRLGVVKDVEVDFGTSSIGAYSIGSRWSARINYRVAPSQVKRFTPEALIVEDAVGGERAAAEERSALPGRQTALSGVMPTTKQ
ncbi:MAG: PRC-barrel domain-containing protein [Candidatus Magasanikbacteria bacterium]|nr:PRC-barrel domain-containing protein [Candidatus Magasanikbacteria bacterium]